jgi:hypothetical protein
MNWPVQYSTVLNVALNEIKNKPYTVRINNIIVLLRAPTDGLDLLHPKLDGQRVEAGEKRIQHLDDRLGAVLRGHCCEPNNVREQHRDLVKLISDPGLPNR